MSRNRKHKPSWVKSPMPDASDLTKISDETFRYLFLGEAGEPITDDLIRELVSSGWPEDELRDMAKMGGTYCRPRNSIIFPTEWIGDDQSE